MSVVLLVHLSDAHLRTITDPLMERADALTRAIIAEIDTTVTGCVIAFTGDATDKGFAPGFMVAEQFLQSLATEIKKVTGLLPQVLSVPGNHDLVLPADASLRDVAINSLPATASATRPKKAIEDAILAPLNDYFAFAAKIAPGAAHTKDCPYYLAVDHTIGDKLLRFHLLNSSWMCHRGESPGTLLYPVNEIQPSRGANTPDYEITMLHHPFGWFKQPETMRPLRNAVEAISDVILTGHEHVGRTTSTKVHGSGDYEYREGEALQDGDGAPVSGFHVLRLDFHREQQTITTYRWNVTGGGGAYLRAIGPVESVLGRNRRRASQPYQLLPEFEKKLEDPEFPVVHSQQGKLRLSDFFVYPDLKPVDDDTGSPKSRVRGETVVETITGVARSLIFGPDRCGKTSLAKRLYMDLHKRGDLPLLLHGTSLKNVTPERVGKVLDDSVIRQYQSLTPEGYFQVAPEKRILIVDDLPLATSDSRRRAALLTELERRFDRISLIGADEFYFEELLSIDMADRINNSLWSYNLYRILPFGYLRCEQFVKNWVSLGRSQPEDAENKVRHLNTLVTDFLRHNFIPQYPWVVMIIVQQGDSADPLHAENGSYGYLLQALITAALAKSRLQLPINGKYAWLGEFCTFREKL